MRPACPLLTDWTLGFVTIPTFPVYTFNFNSWNRHTFIAKYDETFELLGKVKEVDRTKYYDKEPYYYLWDAADGGMMFFDTSCGDACKSALTENSSDALGNMIIKSPVLKWTVSADTTAIPPIVLTADGACYTTDSGGHINLFGIPNGFQITVKATVKIEN